MSYSNYYLNQRLNNLQYEVDNLAPNGSYVTVNGDQEINNIKTFTSLPRSSAVPGNNEDLCNKLYVDTQSGGGLTINDVLSNTLPYTATQTYNNTIIANSLITGTITNAQNSTNSTNSTNTQNINITDTGSGLGVYFPTFTLNNSGNGQLNVNNQNLKYNAGTNTLISANFQGIASSASQIIIQDQTLNNGNYPVIFTDIFTGSTIPASSTNLTYNPSTNLLTTNLNGNALTATNALLSTNTSNVAMTLTTANANLPLLIGSSLVAGNVSVLSDTNLFYNPTSNTLVCQQITGNCSNSNNALNSQNVFIGTALPATTTNLYLTLSTNNNSTYNSLQGAAALRYQPSTGNLSTGILSATASTLSPLYNTTNGGTLRLTGTTTQYSQLQQSGSGFGYDLNAILPSQGAMNIQTTGTYALPSGPDTVSAGVGIGWNATGTGGESDFVNYAQTSATGGFNFYTLGSNTTNLIGSIVRNQPASNNSSQILATTAWVQSAITGGTNPLYYTITNTSPITSSTFTTLLNSITLTGLTNNNIFFLTNGSPNLQNYLTIRLTYTINDNLNTSIVNFTSTLMLFPQRISGNVLTSANFGLGAVPQSIYNLNNNLNGNTTFGYTVGTYAQFGRQYYSTSPNGGVVSGVASSLDTLYLNGQYAVNGTAKFGFNLRPWSQTTIPYGASTTAYMTMSLEILYNPDPSVSISFSNT